jgi:hypothetical protein
MLVNGCDCSIVIKTAHHEKDIPYSDETLREDIKILEEKAAIEGDGVCRGLRKVCGVTGCVVTPLTINTAPLLLYLAMGEASVPVLLSETRNLYKNDLKLIPMEDTENFSLIQDRKNGRKIFEGCRVKSFELRIMRNETIKLKLDISGDFVPRDYTAQSQTSEMSGTVKGKEQGERFNSDFVTYNINGHEYKNIYGITINSKKESGTRTELLIKRALQCGADIPVIIENMTITAQLIREKYECRFFGAFRITISKLVLVSDETEVNTSGAIVSPIRYFVSGGVNAEVFTSEGELIP